MLCMKSAAERSIVKVDGVDGARKKVGGSLRSGNIAEGQINQKKHIARGTPDPPNHDVGSRRPQVLLKKVESTHEIFGVRRRLNHFF